MGELQKRIDAIKFCQFTCCESLGTLATVGNSDYLRKQLREVVEEMRQDIGDAIYAGELDHYSMDDDKWKLVVEKFEKWLK